MANRVRTRPVECEDFRVERLVERSREASGGRGEACDHETVGHDDVAGAGQSQSGLENRAKKSL